MRVGVEASAAYQHIDHLDFAVAIVDNTRLVVAVLESCNHHEQRV